MTDNAQAVTAKDIATLRNIEDGYQEFVPEALEHLESLSTRGLITYYHNGISYLAALTPAGRALLSQQAGSAETPTDRLERTYTYEEFLKEFFPNVDPKDYPEKGKPTANETQPAAAGGDDGLADESVQMEITSYEMSKLSEAIAPILADAGWYYSSVAQWMPEYSIEKINGYDGPFPTWQKACEALFQELSKDEDEQQATIADLRERLREAEEHGQRLTGRGGVLEWAKEAVKLWTGNGGFDPFSITMNVLSSKIDNYERQQAAQANAHDGNLTNNLKGDK